MCTIAHYKTGQFPDRGGTLTSWALVVDPEKAERGSSVLLEVPTQGRHL